MNDEKDLESICSSFYNDFDHPCWLRHDGDNQPGEMGRFFIEGPGKN